MKRAFFTFAALAIIPAALAPAAFASDIVEVKPGLWQGDYAVTISGNPLTQNSEKYCVTPEEASRTVESLVKDITEDGNCAVSNLMHTEGKLSADMACYIAEMGAKVTGVLKGTYTKTSYSLSADANLDLGGLQLPAKARSDAKYIGECPDDLEAG